MLVAKQREGRNRECFWANITPSHCLAQICTVGGDEALRCDVWEPTCKVSAAEYHTTRAHQIWWFPQCFLEGPVTYVNCLAVEDFKLVHAPLETFFVSCAALACFVSFFRRWNNILFFRAGFSISEIGQHSHYRGFSLLDVGSISVSMQCFCKRTADFSSIHYKMFIADLYMTWMSL